VWPGLPPSLPFTSELGQLSAALQRSATIGQTALFDAIDAGLAHLSKGAQQKKILIVVSDGGDNASRTSFEHVLASALRTDAVIYTIGLYDEYDKDANPGLLRKLDEATGAESYFPDSADEATHILERISRDIRSGYTIGYVPAAPDDGAFRKIRVTVNTPDRRKLTVRARSGYVASHHDTAQIRDDRPRP
jgi:Ca-activated chloride channel family protein